MEFRSGVLATMIVCFAARSVPSGAILPIPLEEKKLAQLGTAKFVKENCIVETEGTDCGACSEHCPTKAVNMVPYKGKLVHPGGKAGVLHWLRCLRACLSHEAIQGHLRGRKPGPQSGEEGRSKADRAEGGLQGRVSVLACHHCQFSGPSSPFPITLPINR